MKHALRFVRDETGQDLIEYSLLITFLVLGSAAVLLGVGQSTEPIWSNASTHLASAAAVGAAPR
jgi:Flp pilus assembly pilin Flp